MNYERNTGRYIGRLHYLALRTLNQIYIKEDVGITAEQFRLLTQLWTQDGIPQQTLAALINRDKAAVTRMADTLARKGVIRRAPDKEDGRIKRLYITPKGKRLESESTRCVETMLGLLLLDFSAEEKSLFESFLKRAIENLEKALVVIDSD